MSELLLSAALQPSGLVIEGQAGIGKTTLWLAGVADARERGFRVLSARCAQAEWVLAYAAVADLIGEVEPAVLDGLPKVQRIAVDRVLLRASGDGPTTDQGVVAAAFASIIDRLSAETPVLLAIDDVQWLDPSSQAVVSFAARRFTGRVGLLVTERTEHEGASAASWLQLSRPDGIDWAHVGPLSLGALHALIAARLGRSFPRPTMVRIAEISGGNPFYALELARAIESGSNPSVLPATLAELMRRRIGRLDPGTQDLLLAAACAAGPTVDLLAEVSGVTTERAVELLDEAKSKGIIGFDEDAVTFTHPLLARSVYNDASPRERRAMHRSLADTVALPELRARHMALAASSADPATLEALDAAAEDARGRGAPAAAAELVDLAIGLGGDTPGRRIRSANHHMRAGDIEHARKLLDGLVDHGPLGPQRAMALNLLAAIEIQHNSFAQAAQLLQQALANAGDIPEIRVRTLLLLSFAQLNAGGFDDALQNADRAATEADALANDDLTGQALAVRAMVACMSGHGLDEASLQRAVALQSADSEAPIAFRAQANTALLMAYVGRFDEASEQMTEVRQNCVARGAETDLIFVSVFGTLIEIWRGKLAEAARLSEETAVRASQLGGDHMRVVARTVQAAVAAHAGREAETREAATAAIELAERCGSPRLADWSSISLGFLEVSLGNYTEALAVLQPLVARFQFVPGTEIITAAYIPEAVEAMVALGRHADAEPLIEKLETNGRRLDRPWMLAMSARCRSLWLAARGDVAAAADMAEQALVHHERLPMPVERARTMLLLGQLQRRLRKKETARVTLSEALTIFESVGAPLWIERARSELARTNVAPSHDEGLTPSEHRVAELAASGMTTRDVAAALFISPKTVETNLARIYRKLGIKTRAELGRVFEDG